MIPEFWCRSGAYVLSALCHALPSFRELDPTFLRRAASPANTKATLSRSPVGSHARESLFARLATQSRLLGIAVGKASNSTLGSFSFFPYRECLAASAHIALSVLGFAVRLRCWNIPEHRGEVSNVEALEIAFAPATCPSGAFIDEERIAFGFLVLWHLTIAAILVFAEMR